MILAAGVVLAMCSGADGVGKKWDKKMSCEGCKWLHAKLRIEHQNTDPKVRVYGGGVKRVSRKERATLAIDRWCTDIAKTIYSNEPPVGDDDVMQFGVSDIRMLELQCKKLQDKYRLRAVSLLSSLESNADIPLSILCVDECLSKPRKPTTPPKPPRPAPTEEQINKYSV